MSVTIDLSGLMDKIDKASTLKKEVMKKTLPVFVGYTPKRSGNARSHTTLKNDIIVADYPYAGKLDEGSSRQATSGMTKPTKKEMIRIIVDAINRIGR